jgi:tRNA(Ile)-lysidine synthase TilS/MesJ
MELSKDPRNPDMQPKEAQTMNEEITAQQLDPDAFIRTQVRAIQEAVGNGLAINALSGGVDSSTVTMLGHRALGEGLKTVFIDNGLMREGEPEQVTGFFRELGVAVEIVDARDAFFSALSGVRDPEEKREAVTQAFYRDVFGRIVKESGATFLLQGTILTDVDETVARAAHPAPEGRRAKGRQGPGAPERAVRTHPLPRPGPGRTGDRGGRAGAH